MGEAVLTLRQHRARRILTMKELADKAEVGTQSIVKIERGERVRPSVFGKIAKALEVHPEEIREFQDMVMSGGD
ncbi:MAG: helix-turn-helix domain-containing protein [Chloroflexota bacterium]|nr:helix-turn-helix domain-containing protein [Chloroflexota bacterium]